MERIFWICLAGALGTGVRHLVWVWAAQRFGPTLPYGTLIVNVVGCFLIAAVMQASIDLVAFPPTLRLALTTGFLGGLTTYSTFAFETVKLAREGARGSALSNFALTTLLCFGAILLGLAAARAAVRT